MEVNRWSPSFLATSNPFKESPISNDTPRYHLSVSGELSSSAEDSQSDDILRISA